MNGTTANCGLITDRYDAIMVLLQKIATENKIQNPQIELTAGCIAGDGYLGEKHRAILKGRNSTLKVFIKGAPTNANLRTYNNGVVRHYFLIEIAVYDHIYPAIRKFQMEKQIEKPFTGVFSTLATSIDMDNEILVLPDAMELGFKLWNRQNQMDRRHVEAVLRQYGKFHACSFAMKDQKPDLFNDLVNKYSIDPFKQLPVTMKPSMADIAEKAKGIFDPVKEKEIFERFCEFSDDLMDIMASTIEEGPFSVLTHGDCWCNNMLFKYPENGDLLTPSEICLIDFQLSRLGSPVMDLSYFLYSSADATVYKDLDRLLRVYHDSLSMHVTVLGSDPDDLFPFAELKTQWKKHCNFGVIMAMLLLKVVLMETGESVDLGDVIEESEDIMAGFTKETKNDGVYFARLKKLIEHVYEHGLFKRLNEEV